MVIVQARQGAWRFWQFHRRRTMLTGMDTASPPANSLSSVRFESEAAKRRRLAREAEMIAEALASAQAGLVVDEAEVDAWVDSLGTDHELPIPSRRR
jgi:hypothetical protein